MQRVAVFLWKRWGDGAHGYPLASVAGRVREGERSLSPPGRRVRPGRRAAPDGYLQADPEQTDGRLAIQPEGRTVFEAEPCLTFQPPQNDASWKGRKTGGKMVADDLRLLLIIGDHGRYVRDGYGALEHATGVAQ